ncbi:MAG: DUF3015 family protein [Nitrospirota bacterium]
MTVLAGTSDVGPGCGLGKIVWRDSKLGEGVGPQLLMSTTNDLFLPWQAFGISTGTLGCQNNREFWAEEKAGVFVKLDFDNLEQDMARGGGEHLASLADLMGVPAERQPAFFALAQERYVSLTVAGEVSPTAMIKALDEAMAQHPLLAQAPMPR